MHLYSRYFWAQLIDEASETDAYVVLPDIIADEPQAAANRGDIVDARRGDGSMLRVRIDADASDFETGPVIVRLAPGMVMPAW